MASADQIDTNGELGRMASYRVCRIASKFHWAVFSNSGFRYTESDLSDHTVVCDGCGQKRNIESFDSRPSDSKHHFPRCTFVTMTSLAQPLPSVQLCNGADEISEQVSRLSHDAKRNLRDTYGALKPNERSPSILNNKSSNSITETNYQSPSGEMCEENEEIIDAWNTCVAIQSENFSIEDSTKLSGAFCKEKTREGDVVAGLTSVDTAEYDTFNERALTQPLNSIDCAKNRRHLNFHPLKHLQLDSFPRDLHSKELLDVVILLSALTAKILVYHTSTKRSADDAVWTLPKGARVGTGCVFLEPGRFQTEAVSGRFQHGQLFVKTHRQLIFDEEEARSCTVEIINHCDSTTTLLNGVTIQPSSIPADDRSILTCNVYDKIFINHLNKIQEHFVKEVGNLPLKIKKTLTHKIVIVCHPHGGEKVISFGDSVMVNQLVNIQQMNGKSQLTSQKINNYQQALSHLECPRQVLMYTADTCPGMCGAPILRLKMTSSDKNPTFLLDMWMHHGVDTTEDLNISVMKVPTAEDVQSLGVPSRYQVNVSQASTETLGHGVLTVCQVPGIGHTEAALTTQPSYPVYHSTEKRLETFVAWPSNHTLRPTDLSLAGFFYAGSSDCVRCFQCGLGLRSWKPGDDVNQEHARHRPSCPLLHRNAASRTRPCGNLNLTNIDIVTVTNTDIVTVTNTDIFTVTNTDIVTLTNTDIVTARNTGDVTRTSQTEMRPNSEVLENKSSSVARSPTDRAPEPMSDNSSSKDNLGHSNDPRESPLSSDIPTRLLQREHMTLTHQLTCKVCHVAPIKELFLPCGDLFTCSECSKTITHCPSCRKLILATVVTYFT